MGTFPAGRRLPVKKFSWVMIRPVGIWPFWNPTAYVVSVSNRVIARKLERDQKKNGRGGGEVIRTLTTFSANSAGRLAPQARIPITSCAGSDRSLSLPCYQNLSPLFSSINLRLTFENEDDYSQTTFTSYLWFFTFCLKNARYLTNILMGL